MAARLAFLLATFVAVFLPARTASAFGGVDALGLAGLAGLCDPLGASVLAPAGPFFIVEDEGTLVAAALAAGITDPRGASMNAPLAVVVPEGSIAASDETRCEKADGSPVVRQGTDEHRNAPDATPVADVDPAVPATLTAPPFVLVREEALPSLGREDLPRPAHTRAVEHPPRLPGRSIRVRPRALPAPVITAATSHAAPRGPRPRPTRCTAAPDVFARPLVCGSTSSRPVIVRPISPARLGGRSRRAEGAARLEHHVVPLQRIEK